METAEVESGETTCSVCHEPFKQPKILPCAHVLCRNCLVSWLQTGKDAECPLCKSIIANTKELEANSYETFADSLPTDITLKTLGESANLLRENRVCRVCEGVAAVALCLGCFDMLCPSCVAAHGKLSATRHHVVKDFESLTPEFLVAHRSSRCSNHECETAKQYCVIHKEKMCQICVTTIHRTCQEVSSLEDEIAKEQESLLDLDMQMNDIDCKIVDEVNRTEEKLEQIDQKVDDALRIVDVTCERLRQSLEEGRKRLRDLVQDSGEKFKNNVSSVKTKLLHARGRVASHRLLGKRVRDIDFGTAILGMAAVLQKCVSTLHFTDKAEVEIGEIIMFNSERLGDFEEELRDLRKLTSSHVKFARGQMNFHVKCGFHIKMSPARRYAGIKSGYGKGDSLVFSSDALLVNHLYEIRVDSVSCGSKKIIAGVIVESPDSLTPLPQFIDDLASALLISFDCVFTYGKKTSSNYGRALNNLEVGSRVGVLVDSSSCLHLYFNGVDQGVTHCDVKQPCWAVFDLCDVIRIGL